MCWLNVPALVIPVCFDIVVPKLRLSGIFYFCPETSCHLWGCLHHAARAPCRTRLYVEPWSTQHCRWGGQPCLWLGKVSGTQLCLPDAQKRPWPGRLQLFGHSSYFGGLGGMSFSHCGPAHTPFQERANLGPIPPLELEMLPNPLGHSCSIQQASRFKMKSSVTLAISLVSFNTGPSVSTNLL